MALVIFCVLLTLDIRLRIFFGFSGIAGHPFFINFDACAADSF